MKRYGNRWKNAVVAGMGCLSVLGGLCVPQVAQGQNMADYTAMPPFIADAVPPNVLLLMDNSGSMNLSAYHRSNEAYNSTREYQGYFAPGKCYSYGSSKFTPGPDRATTGPPCASGAPWLGNFLNYLTMTRYEIVKLIMMGGKCAPRATNGTCYPGGTLRTETAEDVLEIVADGTGVSPYTGNKCFTRDGNDLNVEDASCTGTDVTYRLNAEIAAEPNGVIQAVGSKARFGLMQFKSAGDGGKVMAEVGSNVVSMVNAIENTDAATWTPLAESLYEATRYFAQVVPAFNNSDYSYTVEAKDPYYFKTPDWSTKNPGEYVKCCKSFIMVFTDGASTQDINVPAALQDLAHGHHGDHCVGATTADICTGHKTNYSDSGRHYLDDVAYYAHTTDLRQATLPVLDIAGKDLPGFQNVTVYTFYAFGEPIGRELLKTAAKTGGFEDRNNNNQPDLVEEYDKTNNYTGAQGADGLPDTYFESADADDLRDKLLAAITSILQRSASGTAVSVLATSATGDGSLYQSFFYPLIYEGTRDIKWTGYTQGLFLDTFGNLREDTNDDGRLIYNQDKIIRTRFDAATNNVLVDRFHDTDGDGKADSTTPFETVGLRDINGIWEAGKQLALTNPDDRTILTWVDDGDGVVESGEQMAFTTANASTLSPFLRAGAAPYTATNIINFIRGTQVAGMRDRQLTVNGSLAVWKYGDPIHSTPTIVGPPRERFDFLYGDATYTPFFQKYKNRRQVAYVGSNDGMLHAFNSGYYHRGDDANTSGVERGWYTKTETDNSGGKELGQELWGFIPYQLLPHLKWLTQADYTHVYYVDLKPKVTDVKIFTPDADHPNGWGTILIGGFRLGGSCGACVASTGAPPMTVNISGTSRTFYTAYFVLDITNPEVEPKLLWSFSSSDLGLSTSYPAIVRTSPASDAKADHTNAKWYVVFGSGPTGYDAAVKTGGTNGQGAKLFAVDLTAGPGANNSLVKKLPVGDWTSFMADLITLDKDLDFRSDSVYVGRTIDPNGSNGRTNDEPSVTQWTGKMYRLTMGSCGGAVTCSTSTWGGQDGSDRVPSEILNTFPPSGTSYHMGPIVSAPTTTLDDAGNVWIYFGTGRYFSAADKTNAETQFFFGIKDSVLSGSCTQSNNTNCIDNDLVNVSNAQVCVTGVGTCTTATQVSGMGSTTTYQGLDDLINKPQGASPEKDGWFILLPGSRERVLANPTLIGGIAFFPSFTPDNDLCTSSGSSNLYALFYRTGSANKSPVIGTSPSGSGSNQTVNRSIGLGTGLAAQMAVHLGSQGSGGQGVWGAGGGGGGGGGGCQSGTGGFINTSSGNIVQTCVSTASNMRSRYVSWINQR